jgi:acyl carrier protein
VTGAGTGRKYVAPRTATEEILCGIWEQVLGVERVGIEDNFFELGGHSLLITGVISRIHRLFGIEISVRTIFETLTVANLAESILRDDADRTRIERVADLARGVMRTPDDQLEGLRFSGAA